MRGPVALAFDQLVAQADVAECAARHHLMIAAAGAEAVEVRPFDAVPDEVFAGRAVDRDRARGRDVVGRDRVPEHREHARPLDVPQRGRLGPKVLEVRRLLYVRGPLVPMEDRAGWGRHLLPVLVAVKDARVLPLEHVLLDTLL